MVGSPCERQAPDFRKLPEIVIICFMSLLWDYSKEKLQKSKKGRLLLLERDINYGPGRKKVKLSEVKKNWTKLNLSPRRKRLFEILIWGK